MPSLPSDATLLPLSSGRLLVSRAHAVFCPVPAPAVAAVERALAGELCVEALDAALRAELERHGFFDDPRPAEADRPSVQIQLTNACNLACSYCCTNSGPPRQGELDRRTLAALAPQIRAEVGPETRVAILGGEPLLVPWAIDLAEQIVYQQQLELTLFTNGIPLARDSRLARRVAKLTRHRAEVRISLAGPTRELCDAASGCNGGGDDRNGAGRFDAVLAALAELDRHDGCAVIDLMLLPEHVEATAEALPALRRQLPEGTRIALGVLYLSGREEGAHMFGSRGELEAALDRIAFGAGEAIAAPERQPLTHRRDGCDCALGHHLHLRSDGELFSCFKMEERVGSLAEEGGFGAAVRRARDNPHPASSLPKCAACPLATLCGGGCRSDNLLYTGDADEPVCGPWRVQVISELLAEDRVTAVDWPAHHLLAEARARGIGAPEALVPMLRSRHLREP